MKKKVELTWDMHAEAFLRTQFLPRTKGQGFLVENFRKAVEKQGLPGPADKHEWGGFICKMRNAGLVRRIGYAIDAFHSPKSLWRSA